jgi:hypothetical protein
MIGVVVMMLCISNSSYAQYAYWVGTTGDWFSPTDWMYDMPTSGDWAYIDNGGTVQITSGSPQASRLYLGSSAGDSGNVYHSDANLSTNLYLAEGGDGYYSLSGTGHLSGTSRIYDGGNFEQTGGTNAQSTYLYSGSTYQLLGGVNSGYTRVYNSSSFIQSVGSKQGDIYIDSGGLYNFYGGTIDVNSSTTVNGSFNQTAGINTSKTLTINSSGTYDLSGNGELYTNTQSIDTGTFHQTGGIVENFSSMVIGNDPGSTGIFNVSGGTFSTTELSVGYWGSGALNIGNALANISIGGISHGTSTPSVAPKLFFGADSIFSAVSGSSIKMNDASLENWNQNENDLLGFNLLNMVFDNSTGINTLEVAGQDVGYVGSGFVGNYAFDTLTIGGASTANVQLVNNRTNMGGSEALYANNCILGSGSILDLNGINLYCDRMTDYGGTISYNGGQLIAGQTTVVPEPISSTLFVVGGATLGFRRFRKKFMK